MVYDDGLIVIRLIIIQPEKWSVVSLVGVWTMSDKKNKRRTLLTVIIASTSSTHRDIKLPRLPVAY